MLETIIVLAVLLWLLGMVSSYTLGGLVHVLLVIALVVLVIRVIQGRRGSRFLHEPLETVRIPGHVLTKDLESEVATEYCVTSEVNLAHPSPGDLGEELIAFRSLQGRAPGSVRGGGSGRSRVGGRRRIRSCVVGNGGAERARGGIGTRR